MRSVQKNPFVHTVTLLLTEEESKLAQQWDECTCLFLQQKKMTSCWICDAVGHRTSSMFIRVDEYSEFKIISGVSIISHKCIEKVAEASVGPFQKLL